MRPQTIALALLLVVAFAAVLLRRGRGTRNEARRLRDALESVGLSPDRPQQTSSAGEAGRLLNAIASLRAANAQWPAIFDAINPRSDAEMDKLLRDIRAPHQFTPHVALNAIEDGCTRVVASNSNATVKDALREALRRTNAVVDHGR